MNAAKPAVAKPRCALYARYSTDKQKETSIEDQFRECERIAEREGFKVMGRYSDAGISGGTTNRPSYVAMLEAARAHEFEALITEDIDRLWRNRAEYGPRSAELEDLGIHWLSCVGDDRRHEGWGLTITIKAAMAEGERRKASYRTRRAQRGKAERGKTTGGKAYGYRPGVDAQGEKVRVIDREQAKVVLEIYRWRAQGWSGQRIARELNRLKVSPPGASWRRTDTGPRRKNTDKGWRASAIVGDPRRGVGILNNPMYKGQYIWGRSRWNRKATDSDIRVPEQLGADKWITRTDESLRIVPDELWEQVHRIQTANDERRRAIRKGIAAKRTKGKGIKPRGAGRDSKYWLGTLLVCDACGSNYIGDGRLDYVCPAHTAGNCDNNLRFRRDDAHQAVFDIMQHELLDPERIARTRRVVECEVRALLAQEEAAASAGAIGAAMRRLDAETADLRKLNLRPAALAAGLAEIERERAELQTTVAGRCSGKADRARQMLGRLPELADAYRRLMREATKTLAREDVVHDAREALRRLMDDDCIRLTPNGNRTAVTGPLRLKQLGEHVLELTGVARQLGQRGAAAKKLSGSGGPLPLIPTYRRLSLAA